MLVANRDKTIKSDSQLHAKCYLLFPLLRRSIRRSVRCPFRTLVTSDVTCAYLLLDPCALFNSNRIVKLPGSNPGIAGMGWLGLSPDLPGSKAGILLTPRNGSIIVQSRVTSRRTSLSSCAIPPSGEICSKLRCQYIFRQLTLDFQCMLKGIGYHVRQMKTSAPAYARNHRTSFLGPQN